MDFKASDNVPSDAVTSDVTNELDAGVIAETSVKDEKAVSMNKIDMGTDALIAAKAGEALAGAMAEAAKYEAPDS